MNIEQDYTTIYQLRDPRTQQVRYIGKTKNTLERRVWDHMGEARNTKKRTHKLNWLRELQSLGLEPIAEIIATCPHDQTIQFETEAIALAKLYGWNLTNTTNGGEGHVGGHSPETIQKMSEAKKGVFTDAQREAAAKRRGVKRDPAHVENARQGLIAMAAKKWPVETRRANRPKSTKTSWKDGMSEEQLAEIQERKNKSRSAKAAEAHERGEKYGARTTPLPEHHRAALSAGAKRYWEEYRRKKALEAEQSADG